MALDRDLAAAIAATRFGLGAKPGEILYARDDPDAWLLAQIRPLLGADLPSPGQPSSAQRLLEFRELQRERQQARVDGAGQSKFDPVQAVGKLIRDDTGADFLARVRLATGPTPVSANAGRCSGQTTSRSRRARRRLRP